MASDAPSAKKCQGYIDHLETTVAQWRHRRDEGDCVPDRATLNRWIQEGEAELEAWRKALDRAQRETRAAETVE